MSRERQVTEDSGNKVPAYIVTFSDMVTLLLTFFVMLLTLASVQDPELFNQGRDAFWNSIRSLGLGVLFGRKPGSNFGAVKIKYFVSTPDKFFELRTIDAKEEEARRLFRKVAKSMTAVPSRIVAENNSFSVTNIGFSPADATLNESAKKFLRRFADDLQQGAGPDAIKLYVLGIAAEEKSEKERWILSARRAQAVSDFLQSLLPTELRWPVYCWGAGSGGCWVSEDAPISKHSQILIAVLRADE